MKRVDGNAPQSKKCASPPSCVKNTFWCSVVATSCRNSERNKKFEYVQVSSTLPLLSIPPHSLGDAPGLAHRPDYYYFRDFHQLKRGLRPQVLVEIDIPEINVVSCKISGLENMLRVPQRIGKEILGSTPKNQARGGALSRSRSTDGPPRTFSIFTTPTSLGGPQQLKKISSPYCAKELCNPNPQDRNGEY
ncbi:hypothetical protein TNCV_3707851 [Trichonephila clavipes]|nr:hypothetical protein TNCV_3707851 [Trichonephila clavipes]